MGKPRQPRTVEQATVLLERVAMIDREAADVETSRNAAIANTNAVADTMLAPLIEERAAIAGVVETWWMTNGKTLLTGKRKTIELGGCKLGTKATPIALTFTADDWDAAVTKLRAERWAKPYVRVTYAVEKKAVKDALDGKHADQLRGLGFATRGGGDVFVLAPVEQAGTMASGA